MQAAYEELAVLKTRIKLLREAVLRRFIHHEREVSSSAIILASEGLKFLDGDETEIDEEFLRNELEATKPVF